tara:strand:- start:110 stop:613 length:504 start_codon:yes stop_codon:yes gene_type:complete
MATNSYGAEISDEEFQVSLERAKDLIGDQTILNCWEEGKPERGHMLLLDRKPDNRVTMNLDWEGHEFKGALVFNHESETFRIEDERYIQVFGTRITERKCSNETDGITMIMGMLLTKASLATDRTQEELKLKQQLRHEKDLVSELEKNNADLANEVSRLLTLVPSQE